MATRYIVFDRKGFLSYLAGIRSTERVAQDESLEEHDKHFHGGCFEPGRMCCSKRDRQSRIDGVDEVECTEAKVAEIRKAIDFLLNTPPVCRLTGDEFKSDGRRLTDKVPEFFEREYGGVAHSPEFGEVRLDAEGVKSDIGHKVGRAKAVAFAAVRDIIEKGVSYNRSFNWKNRGWQTAVVAAPIEIAGVPYVGEVVLTEIPKRRGIYLHEVEVQEKAKCGFLGNCANAGGERSRLVLSYLAKCCL